MKRRVICLFSLILYLLLACTALSIKIEQEMMIQVKMVERQNRGESFTLSPSVLISDEQGDHLYEIVDGTGWNSGLRVREIDPDSWYMDAYGSVKFSGSRQSYRFLYSASRQPKEGEEAVSIEETSKGNDRYLFLFPEGMEGKWTLPGDSTVVFQTETALLLELADAEFPFFAHTAKKLSVTTEAAERVFSLTEVEQFLEELPSAATVFVLLISGLVFWGAACMCSKNGRKNGRFGWICGVLAAVVLGCSVLVLRTIELPASLLPPDNLFDWQYYREEWNAVTGALSEPVCTELCRVWETAVRRVVFAGGCGVCVVLFICYELGKRRRNK